MMMNVRMADGILRSAAYTFGIYRYIIYIWPALKPR